MKSKKRSFEEMIKESTFIQEKGKEEGTLVGPAMTVEEFKDFFEKAREIYQKQENKKK